MECKEIIDNHTHKGTAFQMKGIVMCLDNHLEGENRMVERIILMPEYGCYPVWLIDEHGSIIDTRLPDELRADTELDARFNEIADRYEALFINNEREFSYVGFSSPEEKDRFLQDWRALVDEITRKTEGRYEIVDDIGKSF